MKINDLSKSFTLIDSVKLKGPYNAFYSLIPGLGYTKVGLPKGKSSPFLMASIPLLFSAIGGYYYSNISYDKYKTEGYIKTNYNQANLTHKVFITASLTYGVMMLYDIYRTIRQGVANKRNELEINEFVRNSKEKIEYRYDANK